MPFAAVVSQSERIDRNRAAGQFDLILIDRRRLERRRMQISAADNKIGRIMGCI